MREQQSSTVAEADLTGNVVALTHIERCAAQHQRSRHTDTPYNRYTIYMVLLIFNK